MEKITSTKGKENLLHNDLVLYFEDTWIGRPCRRGRRGNAMFPPSVCSVYELVVSEHSRTNNSLEGWHRAMQMSLGHIHPKNLQIHPYF